jgi:hypothetical protein
LDVYAYLSYDLVVMTLLSEDRIILFAIGLSKRLGINRNLVLSVMLRPHLTSKSSLLGLS